MTQQQEAQETHEEKPLSARKESVSKKVSDHLANERTFLAWIRTGLATITFGFVVERFNLLLRELGLKSGQQASAIHYSAIIGVMLTVLGVVMMVLALLSFLRTRKAIDEERFHPPISFAILLTIIACVIGVALAVYLIVNAG